MKHNREECPFQFLEDYECKKEEICLAMNAKTITMIPKSSWQILISDNHSNIIVPE